jgi:hypothetical protein
MYALIPHDLTSEPPGFDAPGTMLQEGEMGRSVTKGCLLALVVGVCSIGSAGAQNREKAWELTPYIGTIRFGDAGQASNIPDPGDLATIEFDDAASFGFRFGYHYTKHQMIEFWFSSIGTEGTTVLIDADDLDPMMQPKRKSTVIDADFLSGQVNYIYNFFVHHRDKVVLYLTGGFGINNLSTFGTDVDPDVTKLLAQTLGDQNDLIFNYGGGLRLFGSPKIGVRFDARKVQYRTDTSGTEDYLEFQVGVTMILGGP